MYAERIQVTHVLTAPELGGAQGNTLHTVRHLDRARFAPGLITSPDGPLAADMASLADARITFLPEMVHPIRPQQDWRALWRLVELFRRERPQIVHTHSSKAGILGRWAAHQAGVPIIVHSVHGFPFHAHQSAPRRRLYVALERLAARVTDRYVCVSRADIAKGEAHEIFEPAQTVLIRSGIDLAACRQATGQGAGVRHELGIPPGAPLVGMVACLKPQKDPLTFVRTAAAVLEACPDAWFLLAGDGGLRAAVEHEAAALGLGDRLILAGWRRDVPALLDALDVMQLTSLHEGLPRVVPEAMACRRPVVATAVDGIPEVVVEGVTGYLVAPRDHRAAAARIAHLLRHPEAARRLGEEGERRAGAFDIDAMVRHQEMLYEELLERFLERAA